MEGITYEVRLNLERLAQAGVRVGSLKASGGCAKSKVWLQMKADILGIPVIRLGNDEAGTVGGIMLTGLAEGMFASLDEAADAMIRPLQTYEPRSEMNRRYAECYDRYSRLYESVRPLMDIKDSTCKL
jgi:xylulokinase